MSTGLGEGFFLDILGSHLSAKEARAQLEIAIDWGRYAELYEYDAPCGELQRPADLAPSGLVDEGDPGA